MKVIFKQKSEQQISEDYDNRNHVEIIIDDKEEISIGDCLSECPEDATLCRDLNFVFGIPRLLEQAYEAGKNGEPFEIQDTYFDDSEI